GWLLPVVPLLVALVLRLSGTRLRRRAPRLGGAARVARAVLVVIAVVLGLGIGSRAAVEAANRPTANAANPLSASAASIARGRLIYLANCSSCHGTDGAGGGPQAAGMLPAPGAIGSTVAGLEDGELQSLVTNGVAGTAMPAFATRLSENDRWDLVNYLHDRWPQAK
ncbi:MAG: c-type cytochrome, partial [Candidatus Limnocylindria bacterium]